MFDNYRWPMPVDLWLPIASAVALAVLQHLFMKTFYSTLYDVCKEKKNEQLRKEKSLKSCEHMFKGCYFTFTVIAGNHILQQSSFLPKILFA